MRGKEIEADTTTFGGRIRYARKRLGLSAEQIGKLVYKKAGSVTAWERNNSMPDMSDLDIISTALQDTQTIVEYHLNRRNILLLPKA